MELARVFDKHKGGIGFDLLVLLFHVCECIHRSDVVSCRCQTHVVSMIVCMTANLIVYVCLQRAVRM